MKNLDTTVRPSLWQNQTFSIAIKENKNSLRFEIDHEHHIKDEGIEGLLGFTMAKSYSVSFFTGKIFHYNNLR